MLHSLPWPHTLRMVQGCCLPSKVYTEYLFCRSLSLVLLVTQLGSNTSHISNLVPRWDGWAGGGGGGNRSPLLEQGLHDSTAHDSRKLANTRTRPGASKLRALPHSMRRATHGHRQASRGSRDPCCRSTHTRSSPRTAQGPPGEADRVPLNGQVGWVSLPHHSTWVSLINSPPTHLHSCQTQCELCTYTRADAPAPCWCPSLLTSTPKYYNQNVAHPKLSKHPNSTNSVPTAPPPVLPALVWTKIMPNLVLYSPDVVTVCMLPDSVSCLSFPPMSHVHPETKAQSMTFLRAPLPVLPSPHTSVSPLHDVTFHVHLCIPSSYRPYLSAPTSAHSTIAAHTQHKLTTKHNHLIAHTATYETPAAPAHHTPPPEHTQHTCSTHAALSTPRTPI